ncbi:MltA domain-containing protein [Phenylobacterium sp.]|jgi:membrane-bound lytic murein transglycosylase A|uniref:MltA domain-containing protein n=1 Tax=Phenylobacterium sp. TaxID=1871053 RepID=UPI002F91EC1A
MRALRTGLALAAVAVLAAACTTPRYDVDPLPGPRPGTTRPIPPQPTTPRPSTPRPTTPRPTQPSTPAPPETTATFRLDGAAFTDLPGWTAAEATAARDAFRRHCALWSRRDPQTLLTRVEGAYGGRIADWLPACEAARTEGDARAFFETRFQPWRVGSEGGEARLTAYYAPSIEARRAAEPGFTEPLIPTPSDLLIVDIPEFARALDSETLRKAGAALKGRLRGNRVVPYADRAEIARAGHRAFAWAHPADVYNLQVQGSGRMTLPGGETRCAAFAEQNGYRWRSVIGQVNKRPDWPRNPAGTWASLRQYFDEHPGTVRQDLDLDPSYVFFQEKPVGEGGGCATGASGALLVGGGSLAIDPRYHPYGVPIFVADPTGAAAQLPRLVIAQDTGGAIRRGPLRGDLFVGEGPEAGRTAERINIAGPAFWVLLPKGMQPAPSSSLP